MPYAFGHIVGAYVLTKLTLKKLNKVEWMFLLFGAILPDIDLLIDWTIHTKLHRLITHTIWFIPIAFMAAFIFLKVSQPVTKQIFKHFDSQHNKILPYALALALGITFHILLDFITGLALFPLYPLLQYLAYAEPINHAIALRYAILDMALGVAFIGYLLVKKKIKL